mgnify:CR=1 FL=1
MNETVNQVVYQVVPEEYQGLAMTIVAIVGGAITIYFMFIQPLMNKSRTSTLLGEVQAENASLKEFIASNPTREEFEEMINALARNSGVTEEDMWRKLNDSNSLTRIAEPEEIASAVVFLASDDSSAMTGHNMTVSCGFHLIHPQEIHKL